MSDAAVSTVVPVVEVPNEIPSLQVLPSVTVPTPEVGDVATTEVTEVTSLVEPVPTTGKKKGKRGKKSKTDSTVTTATSTDSKGKKGKKGKKGRPALFVGELKSNIVSLLRHHKNATRVQAILSAVDGDDANERVGAGIANPISISMPTLLNLAKGSRVTLPRGRRKSS